MKRPSHEVVKALAQIERQYPDVSEWLQGWCAHELTQLPNVTQNMALAQGRCQVLMELSKLITESPDMAAKSK